MTKTTGRTGAPRLLGERRGSAVWPPRSPSPSVSVEAKPLGSQWEQADLEAGTLRAAREL